MNDSKKTSKLSNLDIIPLLISWSVMDFFHKAYQTYQMGIIGIVLNYFVSYKVFKMVKNFLQKKSFNKIISIIIASLLTIVTSISASLLYFAII